MRFEQQYLQALADLIQSGESRDTRAGKTKALFGHSFKVNVGYEFPLLTTKFVNFTHVLNELLWFLRAEEHINSLQYAGTHIWDAWANEAGYVGPIYGVQWRKWPTIESCHETNGSKVITFGKIDQIQTVIDLLKTDPTSRRMIVSAWNVSELKYMSLPPCHYAMQFYCSRSDRVSLMVHQRSCDACIGLPYNIASYAILLRMICGVTKKLPDMLILTVGDFHIYEEHIVNAYRQLANPILEIPQLTVADVDSIDDFTKNHFILDNYKSAGYIHYKVFT